MVSASSSRASSWKLKIEWVGCLTIELARGSFMPSTAASCSMTVFIARLLGSSAGQREGGSRPSPRTAGAAERRPRARVACGTGLDGRVGTVAPGTVRVGLVPDRLLGPRLTGLVAGPLAPAGHEDQQRHDGDDGQRDAREDENGLGDVHGRQPTGTALRSPAVLPCVGVPVRPRPRRLDLRGHREQRPSSAGRPTSMLPIGSPASVQYSGTLTAGCPVTLNSAVKEAYLLFRSKSSAPSPSVSNQPRGRGVIVQTGASRTS